MGMVMGQTRGFSPEPPIIAYLSTASNPKFSILCTIPSAEKVCVIEHETERMLFAQSIEEKLLKSKRRKRCRASVQTKSSLPVPRNTTKVAEKIQLKL